jgi:hypothetical protein
MVFFMGGGEGLVDDCTSYVLAVAVSAPTSWSSSSCDWCWKTAENANILLPIGVAENDARAKASGHASLNAHTV